MAEYEDREHQFDASLGNVVGGYMLDLTKADLTRQQGWLGAVQALAAADDKTGQPPTIVLDSGITDADGKAIAGADISFPVVLAMLGEQFAADTAELDMTMNVSASTLSDTSTKAEGSGEAKFGIAGLSATVHISASMASENKRESDYRATTTAKLTMKRVPTPEPIQRVLAAFMKTVDVECQIAEALIETAARGKAQKAGLIAPADEPAPKPDPKKSK